MSETAVSPLNSPEVQQARELLGKAEQQHLEALRTIRQSLSALGQTIQPAALERPVEEIRMPGREVSGKAAVLAYIKSRPGCSTRDINTAWAASGRPGRADNALHELNRGRQVTRQEIAPYRGSQYWVKESK